MSDPRMGRAVRALVALLDLDAETLPVDLTAQRAALQLAAIDTRAGYERDAAATRDRDEGERARRWARAVDAAWELAKVELDVASGLRRAGAVA